VSSFAYIETLRIDSEFRRTYAVMLPNYKRTFARELQQNPMKEINEWNMAGLVFVPHRQLLPRSMMRLTVD